MLDDEDSVTKKLLSPVKNNSTMDSVVVENGKGDGKAAPEKEPDLRLHDAVCDPDNMDEIAILIEEEPNLIFETDKTGHTPLHSVVIDADPMAPEICKMLLGVLESADGSQLISIERPELLNMRENVSNYTALHYAALNRQEELVAALLRWGADPYLQDHRGNTALHLTSQGMLETAILCGRHLIQADRKKSLINMFNSEEKTALHKAIDEKSILMSKFLLKPENKFDMSQQDSRGLNILHYTCSGTEESEALSEIVKAIINRCTASQLNQQDNKQRTPLILTAIQRLPKIAELLVNEDKIDVTKVDKVNKTALHYACQSGCYPKGYQCVEVLIGRKFQEKKQVVQYLYRMEDSSHHTAFMYLCLNCPPAIVQKYVEVVKDPYDWMTGTYATLLYKHCPLALTNLMDNAFTEDKKRSTDFEDNIVVDYGPITGYDDPVALPQQETRYLKQALYWEYESQKEILLHPLVQLFMIRKWHKLRWIILTWVLWQFIWLGAFTTLILSYYAGPGDGSQNHAVTFAASFVMLLYIVSSMVNEGFEFYTVKCAYLINVSNLMQVAQDLLALIAIYPIFMGIDKPPIWQKYTTGTGVLLAYILSMKDIGKLHKSIGLVVEVLKQVLLEIVHVLLSCSPLWVGFTLAFVVIFNDDKILNSAFPGPIVKVLVMMTGEFEFNDTFNHEDDDKTAIPLTSTERFVQLLFFLSFLIAVPVAFFNLLTGFALDRVMELRERAKVGRIAKQIEHIYFIESILLSLRPLGKIIPIFPYENWLRKLNVTTKWIDQKRTFYTMINEQIRVQERRNLSRRRIDGCLSGLIPSFCVAKVPQEVEQQIFALALQEKTPTCPTCNK